MDTKAQQLQESAERHLEAAKGYWRRKIDRQTKDAHLLQGYKDQMDLAHYRELLMGQTLNKLQQRIGRQRVANNKQRRRIQELELQLEKEREKNREFRADIIRRHNDRWAELDKPAF